IDQPGELHRRQGRRRPRHRGHRRRTGARPGPGLEDLPSVEIAAGETFDLASIEGSGRITHVWLTTHTDNWRRLLLLRAYWDGAAEPAVEVPVGDFFGQGWGRFAQLSSAMVAVNPHGGFNSYWPMPFSDGARLTIENLAPEIGRAHV